MSQEIIERFRNDGNEGPPRHLEYCLATCHSLFMHNGAVVGDQMEEELLKAVGAEIKPDCALDKSVITTLKGTNLYLLKRFEFSSDTQCMSVAVAHNNENGDIFVYTKGAPEKVKQLCLRESLPADLD